MNMTPNPRAGWTVKPVTSVQAHVLHAYFNMSPESPDGRWVLAFVSRQDDAQVGDVCLFARDGSETRVLAAGIEVEDSHRQACQQFCNRGQAVAFHHLHEGVWRVEVADVNTGARQVLAENRQVGFCQASWPWIVTMPLHWDRNADGDLHVVDVGSGARQATVPVEAIRPVAAKLLPDAGLETGPAVLAFPLVSPNGMRIACKISQPGSGGDFRSKDASKRHGLFTYDLQHERVIGCSATWGHPAWHPDNRRILTVAGARLVWLDTDLGQLSDWPEIPDFRWSHPSVSPNGQLVVTDWRTQVDGRWMWRIDLVNPTTHATALLFTHPDDRPATTSWRRPHPHPVFNASNQRVYFNVNEGSWTRLYVAQRH